MTISVSGDTDIEPDETFTLRLDEGSVSGATIDPERDTASAAILDDDEVGAVDARDQHWPWLTESITLEEGDTMAATEFDLYLVTRSGDDLSVIQRGAGRLHRR